MCVVISKGDAWGSGPKDRPLSHEMRKLLDKLGINGWRNYYCLRHTTQTIGDESGDYIAVRRLMGHSISGDISEMWRARVSNQRLRKVTEHVREWVFADDETAGEQPDALPMVNRKDA